MCSRKILLLLITLSLYGTAKSQLCFDDTVRIEEVTVYSTYRQLHSIGSNSFKIDTLKIKNYEGMTLGELLQSSGVNVRSYGVGGLAMVALRGGGSVHTAVVWNGINIQSPMNGGVNLSHLPVVLFNNISVQHGGIGTIYGSGAVSGVVVLESGSILAQTNSIKTGFLFGQGNTRGAMARVKIGNPMLALSLKYNGAWADNDFEFINTYRYGSPRERITNAQAKQNNLLVDAAARISSKTLWNLSGWATISNKNIQTLMSSSQPSQANQVDSSFAISSNLSHNFDNLSIRLRSAFVYTKNRFSDPASNIFSLNRCSQLINELEVKKTVNLNHELIAGLGYTHDMASSDSYTTKGLRNRVLGYASLITRFFNNRLILVGSVRNEMVDGDFIPVVLSGGAEFHLDKLFKLKATSSTNYRLPTLNDLYWASTTYASGNPNLKPENGWNADFGLDFNYSVAWFQLYISNTIFYSELNDWIVWLPDSQDNGRWKPNNLNRGKSHGVESFLRVTTLAGLFRFRTDLSYTYTNSEMFDSDSYSGKPMIYIPKHRIGANISLLHRGYSLIYNHSFSSERNTDELNKLPPHNVGDITLGYTFSCFKSEVAVSLGINNVWNEKYQLMRNYAMPLRNYFVRFTIEFQSQSTK